MKKILSLLLCLSLIFVVSGCAKIDETWRNLTGEPEPIDIEWQTSEGDLEASPDGSGVVESIKHIDETVLEVPEYESNALKYVVNDASYGSRNITVRYEKVDMDYQGLIDSLIKVKDSPTDEELVVNAKSLAELFNIQLKTGLNILSDGEILRMEDTSTYIYFKELEGIENFENYSLSVYNTNNFRSYVRLETNPMVLKTRADVLELLKMYSSKLGLDLFDDKKFVEALNDISYQIPMDNLETQEYNDLSINLYDNNLDELVLCFNILGEVDNESPFYTVSMEVNISQPRYEEIKASQQAQ